MTSYFYETTYLYAAVKLWIAYGLAAFFTLLAVVIGMLAILVNSASYDNSFSTVLRTTRSANLDVEIEPQDLDGQSPLPSYLGKASITMPHEEDEVQACAMDGADDTRTYEDKSSTALLMPEGDPPSLERRNSSATW